MVIDNFVWNISSMKLMNKYIVNFPTQMEFKLVIFTGLGCLGLFCYVFFPLCLFCWKC